MTGFILLKYFLFAIFIPASVCTFNKRTENIYIVDEPAHKRNTNSEMQCMHYCQIKKCHISNMKVLNNGEILCHCHHDHITTIQKPGWIISEPMSHVYGNHEKPTNPTCVDKRNDTVRPNKILQTYQGETNLQFGYGKNCLLNVNSTSEKNSLEFRCDISKGSPIQIFPVMQSENGNAFRIKSDRKTLTYWSFLNGEKQIGEFTSDQNEGEIFFIEATQNDGYYRISTNCGCYLTVVNASLSRKATFFKCNINPQESDIFRIEGQSSLKLLDGITSAQVVYKEDCYLLLLDTEKKFVCSENKGSVLEINCNDDGDSCKLTSNGLSLYATFEQNSDIQNKKLELKEGDGENFTLTYMDGYHRIATWDGCVLRATDPTNMTSTMANFKCKTVLDNASLFQIKMTDANRIYSKTDFAEVMYLKFINANCYMTTQEDKFGYGCEGRRDWFEISAISRSDRYQIKSGTKILHWFISEQNQIDTDFRDGATNDTFIIRSMNGESYQIFTENGCPLIANSILKRLVFSCNHTTNDGLLFEFLINTTVKIDEMIGGKLLQLIWYKSNNEKCFMVVNKIPYNDVWNVLFSCDVTRGTQFEIRRKRSYHTLSTHGRDFYWNGHPGNFSAYFKKLSNADTFLISFLSHQSYVIQMLFVLSNCYLFIDYVSSSIDNNAKFRCETNVQSQNTFTIKVANDEFFAPYVGAGALKLAIKINDVMYQMTAVKVTDNVHEMYFSNELSALPLQLVSIPQSNYFQIKSQFGFLFWKRIGGAVKDAEFRIRDYGDEFLIRPSSASIVKILWRSDCPLSFTKIKDGLFKAVFICKQTPGSGGVELFIVT